MKPILSTLFSSAVESAEKAKQTALLSVCLRCISVSIAAILLTGCVLRLGYNTLNFWIPYYVSDYVSLDSAQERAFEANLDKALEEHRQKELPKIHRLISSLQVDLEQPLSFHQISQYHDKFTAIGQESATIFVPTFSSMLRSLNDQQRQQFNKKIAGDIEKLRQERAVLTTKQKIKKRSTGLQKTAKQWLGTLTNKQRALLTELAGYQVEMEPTFFSVRENFLSDWKTLMAEPQSGAFQQQLTVTVHQLLAFENPAAEKELLFYLNRRFDVMRRLNHSLTDDQRDHLQGLLTGLRKDIAKLIYQ
ncbi:DUF6279 family lipoprotein [Photobacterium kagoshimensis]|uniref:DUF6279 family lipoprotein n=1 Tax=Photobacterium kagoshimensis TaxID=2910242 RepID=UPI003D11A7F3